MAKNTNLTAFVSPQTKAQIKIEAVRKCTTIGRIIEKAIEKYLADNPG